MADLKHIYDKKKKYVDSLNNVLTALTDFEAIEYARDPVMGEEYIRLRDKLGQAFYVNVTGNSEEAIFKEVSRMALGTKAHGFIINRDKIRAIAPMFRRAV